MKPSSPETGNLDKLFSLKTEDLDSQPLSHGTGELDIKPSSLQTVPVYILFQPTDCGFKH